MGAGPAAEAEDGPAEGAESGAKRRSHRGRARHPGGCEEVWHHVRMELWSIVESKYFNRGIMMAILTNTISMGIEHHQQVHTSRRYTLTGIRTLPEGTQQRV